NVLVKQGQNVMQDDVLIEFEGTIVEVAAPAPAPKPQAKPAAPKAAPAPAAAPKPAGSASAVKAPLPGSIIKVLVSEGQSIKRGDVLLTMESMKMENNIRAEKDGVVGKIYVQAGKSVMQDDVLLDLA
ncbi:MAG: biotin/lipoyl-binding protein, partial [Paludibacteraceae bacterium]|nr:biotin/lipoyl-binding protein [Paludibacteraceae bacterium]